MKIEIHIDSKNRWTAQVVKNGQTMNLKGTTLEVGPIFSGDVSAGNPLVVVFKLDNGEIALPPLGITVEKGQLVLQYDTLFLKNK